ncbi:MAG: hypothetical protein ACRD9S_25440, partial [Pyrinomonadaceae bacterium]
GLRHLTGLPILGLTLDGTKITDAGMESIGKLSGLIELTLNQTGITSAGFKHLKGLNQIRILKFEETAVNDDAVAVIKDMKKLQIFGATDVKGITDKGIKLLQQLPKVHTMELRGTSVTDATVAILSKYPRMHCYDLAQSQVTEKGLENLKNYTNVHSLAIDGKQASETGLRFVKNGLPLFQEIYLYGPDINDAFMSRAKTTLNGLAELNLFGTGVTDEGLKHLQEVKTLTALRIAAAKVSPEAIDRLRQALPNVAIAVSGEAGWHFITPSGVAADITPMP